MQKLFDAMQEGKKVQHVTFMDEFGNKADMFISLPEDEFQELLNGDKKFFTFENETVLTQTVQLKDSNIAYSRNKQSYQTNSSLNMTRKFFPVGNILSATEVDNTYDFYKTIFSTMESIVNEINKKNNKE